MPVLFDSLITKTCLVLNILLLIFTFLKPLVHAVKVKVGNQYVIKDGNLLIS